MLAIVYITVYSVQICLICCPISVLYLLVIYMMVECTCLACIQDNLLLEVFIAILNRTRLKDVLWLIHQTLDQDAAGLIPGWTVQKCFMPAAMQPFAIITTAAFCCCC